MFSGVEIVVGRLRVNARRRILLARDSCNLDSELCFCEPIFSRENRSETHWCIIVPILIAGKSSEWSKGVFIFPEIPRGGIQSPRPVTCLFFKSFLEPDEHCQTSETDLGFAERPGTAKLGVL